jgi:hypothetical protein
MPCERVNTCDCQPSLSAIGLVAIMSAIQSGFDHELFAWMCEVAEVEQAPL